jgi:hypothetical protein
MSHEHLFINGVNMKYIKIFEGRRMWAWFILLLYSFQEQLLAPQKLC